MEGVSPSSCYFRGKRGNGALQNIFTGCYYDPVVGRFVNADDVGILGASETVLGYNLFAYCKNNSINNLEICGFYSLSLKDFKSDWAGREILW